MLCIISKAKAVESSKELRKIIIHSIPMPHPTISLRYSAVPFPFRHTFVSLAPHRRLPRKMHSPSLLAGGNQLVQVVHIGDLARRLAATA